MYKKTDPQKFLFSVETQLSSSLRDRLENSWAQLFKVEVLPILLKSEHHFSILYGKTGRPNFSVARMLGLFLLQELYDLSDQQCLDSFGFDIRWRYALDVSDDEAYLSRRSFVEFRRRLADKDPEMKLIRAIFQKIGKTAIEKIGLSTAEQRIDSTHIVSNICTRGRLDLFQNSIDFFIKSLDLDRFSRIPKYIRQWHETEKKTWFGSGPLQRRANMDQLAKYLCKLIAIFKNDQQVTDNEPYQLVVRLFEEQCTVITQTRPDTGNNNDASIIVKKATKGEVLQSPYDPDASFGHKGIGYSAQITETCNNKGKPEIITDYEVHGAARSDKGKAPDILNRLESAELSPETLYADGGYPSSNSSLDIIEREVEFIAPVNRSRLPDDIMGRDQFTFDENGFVLKCPAQQEPINHRMRSANNQKGKSLHAIFNGNICRACSKLDRCPVRAPNNRERGCKPQDTKGNFRLEITQQLRLRDQMYADQQTEQWKTRYKIRSGIEATMSELKRRHGIGKLRLRRIAKVRFAVTFKVMACNIKRWAKAHLALPWSLYRFFNHILGCISNFGAIVREIIKYRSKHRVLKILGFV